MNANEIKMHSHYFEVRWHVRMSRPNFSFLSLRPTILRGSLSCASQALPSITFCGKAWIPCCCRATRVS